ncbi:dash complex subunit dad3 [Pyrrhoderma noxium]|uniref:DASH complex subunit DAD3 n=1 Tax=Pyrrhoderma noxium TaxID=2282107 RepID=A0A286UW53_9AGAM|nr:dash complex subunit dad3 [Pyrrhoderma noxium]
MSNVDTGNEIFDLNPYEGHPALSTLEADVLWEYAKLSQHVKILVSKTRQLSDVPDKRLLNELRVLETKMGLVLTLFKASVWGVINEQPASEDSVSFDEASDITVQQ